jgi:hypothetical protein
MRLSARVTWRAGAQGAVGTQVRLLHVSGGVGSGDPSASHKKEDANSRALTYGTIHLEGAFASAAALANALAFVRGQHVAADAHAAVRMRCASAVIATHRATRRALCLLL